MTRHWLTIVLAGAGLCCWAGQARKGLRTATVSLSDGSVVVGRIVRMQQDAYELQSASLGTVKIPVSQIDSVVFRKAGAQRAGSPAGDPRNPRVAAQPAPPAAGRPEPLGGVAGLLDLQGLMRSMVSNPEVMKLIEGLKDDQEIQKFIHDPEIARAIDSGNLLRLMSNPDLYKLLSLDKVKEVKKRVVEGEQRK